MTTPPRDAAAQPARKLRLFVALDLPAAARSALARFRDAAADPAVWRALPESSFHVTLAFLGNRPEEQVEQIVAVLRALAPRAAPELALGAGLLLPPRRARVLTVALEDPGGKLGSLQAELGAALAEAALYEPEARPFRPHVTVARLRAGERAPLALELSPGPLAFTGGAVTLYSSRLGRGGAVYEPIFAAPG